jgi:NAD(P)-dependent dehydrogenase (short-subunit alcohol dehydrogenase family)
METMSSVAVIAGTGPVIGAASARRFAREGYAVALLARTEEYAAELAAELRSDGHEALAVTADVTDADDVSTAFDRVNEELGAIEVLVHNANSGSGGSIDDCSPAAFEQVWRTRAFGGFLCVREALADLRETDGTVLFSGTSFGHDGNADMVDWGSGAFATRGLATSLASGLGEDGVHVAYVSIGGRVVTADDPGPGAISAADVADTYAKLAAQENGYTTELDLQPVG